MKVQQQQIPTPFHLDRHQYAHVLRINLSRVGCTTPMVKLLTVKNQPFRSLLLVTSASLRFRPPAL